MKRRIRNLVTLILAVTIMAIPSLEAVTVVAAEDGSIDEIGEIPGDETGEIPGDEIGEISTDDLDADGDGTGEYGNFEYELNEGGNSVTITGYHGRRSGKLTIPGTIEEKPVTAIGNYVFASNGEESFSGTLDIPATVTSIGEGAFEENWFIGNLTLPEGLVTVGANAFGYSDFDGVLTIPSSVTEIGNCAFGGNEFIKIVNNSTETLYCDEIRNCDYGWAYVKEGETEPAQNIEMGTYTYKLVSDSADQIPETGGSVTVTRPDEYIPMYYKYTPQAAKRYYLSITEPKDGELSEIYVNGVFDESGRRINCESDVAYDEDGNTIKNAYSCVLDSGKTYYVAIAFYEGSTTSCKLNVGEDPSWAAMTATENDISTTGRVDVSLQGSDVWYRYVPNSTGYYFAEAEGDGQSGYKLAEIYDGNGNMLVEIYNRCRERFELTSGLQYYFKCSPMINDEISNFSLSIMTAPDYFQAKTSGEIPDPGAVVSRDQQDNSCYEEKWFTFSPTENGTYTFYSVGCEIFTAHAVLYDSTGEIIGTRDYYRNDDGSNGDVSITRDLREGERYYIYVGASECRDDCPASFTFHVAKRETLAENMNTSTPLTISVLQDVNYNGYAKYYSFTPGATGNYVLYSYDGTSPAAAVLNDDYATAMGYPGQGNRNGKYMILHEVYMRGGKTYLIKAYSLKDEDNYKLAITSKKNYVAMVAIPLVNGRAQATVTPPVQDRIWFSYVPSSTKEYNVYAETDINLSADLFDSEVEYLSNNQTGLAFGGFNLSYEMTAGQTYYIGVWPSAYDADGNLYEPYTFSIQAEEKEIAENRVKEAAIELDPEKKAEIRKGQVKYYKFEPENTGYYAVYTSGGKRPLVSLLDQSFIGSEQFGESYGTENRLMFRYEFEAGTTYYFKAASSVDEDAYKLGIKPARSFATDTATPVYAGDCITIPAYSGCVFYSITPTISGSYTFYQDENYVTDEGYIGSIYEEVPEDGWQYYGETSITSDMDANKTYYLACSNYGSSDVEIFVKNNDPVDISAAVVLVTPDTFTYTGEAFRPDVVVKLGDKTLINNRDYTLRYSDNTKPGTGKIRVTGKGNYKGTVTATFTINEVSKPVTPTGTPEPKTPTPPDPTPVPVPKDVTAITLDKTAIKLKAGKSTQLTATITPADADDKTVKWSTDNKKVATVSQSGKVSAKAAGEAIITATASNGLIATCTVKVPGMTLNDTELVLKKGDSSSAIKAILVNDTLKSAVSSRKSVATVRINKNRIIITAKKTGKANITVKSKAGLSETIKVTVQKKDVTTKKLELSKSKVTLSKKGKKAAIKVTATPDAISTGEKIKVSSSNKKIAKAGYNASTGKITITAKKKGKCTITVSAGKIVKEIAVKVKK